MDTYNLRVAKRILDDLAICVEWMKGAKSREEFACYYSLFTGKCSIIQYLSPELYKLVDYTTYYSEAERLWKEHYT